MDSGFLRNECTGEVVHENVERKSLLQSLGHNSYKSDDVNPCGLTLLGPRRSGKTSLLMDAAYNCCASSPNGRAIFIMPEHKKSQLDFPMRCHQWERNDDEMISIPNSDSSTIRNQFSSWTRDEEEVLSRIDVHYVKDVKELIQLLALLQCHYGTNENDGQLRAVVVDDLDFYVKDDIHYSSAEKRASVKTTEIISLMHLCKSTRLFSLFEYCHFSHNEITYIVALMNDAANFFHEACNHSILKNIRIYTALTSDRLQMSPTDFSLLRKYTPIIAEIDQDKQNGDSGIQTDFQIWGSGDKTFDIYSSFSISIRNQQHKSKQHVNYVIGSSPSGWEEDEEYFLFWQST